MLYIFDRLLFSSGPCVSTKKYCIFAHVCLQLCVWVWMKWFGICKVIASFQSIFCAYIRFRYENERTTKRKLHYEWRVGTPIEKWWIHFVKCDVNSEFATVSIHQKKNEMQNSNRTLSWSNKRMSICLYWACVCVASFWSVYSFWINNTQRENIPHETVHMHIFASGLRLCAHICYNIYE